MTAWLDDGDVIVYAGDCIEVMRELAADSIDAVITDPPYGLEFMGKAWDKFDRNGPASFENLGTGKSDKPTPRDPNMTSRRYTDKPRWSTMGSDAISAYQAWCTEWAVEAYRVLKPGGHLAAFGGTRTAHRLACAIEDAGFEIRDTLAWLYGSGFPKSLDVSKAIDKRRDDRQDYARVSAWLLQRLTSAGVTRAALNERFQHKSAWQMWTTTRLDGAFQPHVPKWDQWCDLRDWLGFGRDMDAEVWRLNGRKGAPGEAWEQREVLGRNPNDRDANSAIDFNGKGNGYLTAPATPDAEAWQGWGTALKPAHEPITLARKPLAGTVSANVLQYGTGALHIDACRIEHAEDVDLNAVQRQGAANPLYVGGAKPGDEIAMYKPGGRWPANVLLDAEAAALLDQQTGELVNCGGPKTTTHRDGMFNTGQPGVIYADRGGASRFFYTAKASGSERNDGLEDRNGHPTVKPVDLMRWLIRLLAPPGALILDPFAGSGTTGVAARLESVRCVLIEREAEYLPIIAGRLSQQSLLT